MPLAMTRQVIKLRVRRGNSDVDLAHGGASCRRRVTKFKASIAAIFLALCLIGWVASATLAQDPRGIGSARGDAAAGDRQTRQPPPCKTLPAPSAESRQLPTVVASAPVRRCDSASEPPRCQRATPTRLTLLPSVPDDPEKAALAFVEQNQKMAESQLKNLKAEEAKLRDRLRKVEAGIKRWESLLGALKQSQGNVAVVSPASCGKLEASRSGRARAATTCPGRSTSCAAAQDEADWRQEAIDDLRPVPPSVSASQLGFSGRLN